MLFVEELYVARDYWRTGVSRLLMNGLLEVAAKQDCSRVEWMVDLDNADVQWFYAALSVPEDTSKLFYRVQDHDLLRVAHDPGAATP